MKCKFADKLWAVCLGEVMYAEDRSCLSNKSFCSLQIRHSVKEENTANVLLEKEFRINSDLCGVPT